MWRDGVRVSRSSELRDMLGGRFSSEEDDDEDDAEEEDGVLTVGWLLNGDTVGSSMGNQCQIESEREKILGNVLAMDNQK